MILWPVFRPIGLLAGWYVRRYGEALVEWRKVNDPEWKDMTDLHLRAAEMRGGVLHITAEAKVVANIANKCAAMLVAADAKNYVQMDFFSPDHKRPVRFTVQWALGESPAEQNARLRKELAAVGHDGKEGV